MSGLTAPEMLSKINNTQHAMRHNHHNLRCDCQNATTCVLDGVPATCKHSSGIAVWCDAISMEGDQSGILQTLDGPNDCHIPD